MNCPECKADCCNNKYPDIRNAAISLIYVHRCFSRGDFDTKLLDRMAEQISRIELALKECNGTNKKPECT